MGYETIEVEKKGPIELLTLNRPKCLNAINFTMRDEFRDYLKTKFDDLDTRVIVLTGAGKGFSAGLDIKDAAIMTPEGGYSPQTAYENQTLFSDFILYMRQIPQPIIGAINGVAVGAGFSISMACDIRLCVPEARFQGTYINLGFGGADMGSSWLFPRSVGNGNAARYLLTGDFLSAPEAHRMGFVQELIDKEQIVDEAMKMAKNLASKSPLGLRLTKEALNRNTGGLTLEDAIKLEDRNQAMTIAQLSLMMQGKK